tara:strand:+ start:168 stop:497 length:330 start_codon:yes stop_codon:yes gene_type:complete
LDNFEALQSQTVDWLNRDDLWIRVHQEPLDFNPFFLLIREVVGSLSLLNLLIELVNDNRDEQIHDEKSGEEDVNHKNGCSLNCVVFFHHFVLADGIDCVEHIIRPHLKG